MTATSPPPVSIEWEPHTEGIDLHLKHPLLGEAKWPMPTMSVRELRDDMEEAAMLARGFSKVEDFAQTIEPGCHIILMGDSYEVENTLASFHAREEVLVLQFRLNTYSPVQAELTFPPDQLVTYWRPIE